MKSTRLVGLIAFFVLTGCQSTNAVQIKQVVSKSGNSSLIIAKEAIDFDDADIEIPAYFNTQGLQFCSYEPEETDTRCPLAKKTIRMYFGDVKDDVGTAENKTKRVFSQIRHSVASYDVKLLENTLENQFAGVNRFRILTRDTQMLDKGLNEIFEEEGSANLGKKLAENKKLTTDYLLKVDVLKTANMMYGNKQSLFESTIEITTGVINPYTREKLSYPNIGKIRVSNFDVRDRKKYTSVIINGDYYRGFNYSSQSDVNAVFNDMASRSFDIMLTRLLKEMPATAQVLGVKRDRVSLDRGQNAGVLPNETMIIFDYSAGFAEPIGVATVNPSAQSAQGKIIRWKNSALASDIKNSSKKGIYRPSRERKLFAVSVGVPATFIKERSSWSSQK